ncbi:MAG: aromatic ring-hydroxylating dioxygenase subunit alpha [Chitinophagaceae bacterium]|nr:aromatic ring-hydroxylating dioxygenase subunit alpha [Oligoflexus sp.]
MQPKVTHDENQTTQPHVSHPVFNNWDVIAQGWFFVGKSRNLKPGKIMPFVIHGHRLAVFRGTSGQVIALDAYCPHMGTDLTIGKVKGDSIECYFHHWRFDADGACVDIPCLKERESESIPPMAKTSSYAVCERYGSIWVYPAKKAPNPVAEFPDYAGLELDVWLASKETVTCHQHVAMINGLDAQHLKTVHKLDLDMSLTENESSDGRTIELILEGDIPDSLPGKLGQLMMGRRYRYGMIYTDANIGLLTILQKLPFFGTRALWPQLHMIYAYKPLAAGLMELQSIYVTKKRRGPLGWLYSRLLLTITVALFHVLKAEDGKVYDNMRFSTRILLPIDQPIARFIAHTNRLKASIWSPKNSRPS